MPTKLTTKPLLTLLALLLALTLPACSPHVDISYDTEPPTLDESELPNAADVARPEDQTDYRALAYAVFENAPVASADDFTYTKDENGITLTAYTGEGGVLILPDVIEEAKVVALGDALFKDNTALTALAIPDSVERIGAELLSGCRSLQVLKTPQLGQTRTSAQYLAYFFGAASPQSGAFKIGSSLDTVILSEACTRLDAQAFYSCYRLIMVILPETLREIGSYAYSGCSSLKYTNLPDGLTTLGDGALSDCTSLLSLTLPDSLTSIGSGVLMGCTDLIELSVPYLGSTPTQSAHFGYFFGAEAYTWNADFVPATLRYVTVRGGDIPNYAFYECENLYDVRLPDTCQSIGVRAFHGCHSLLSVELPDSVTHVGDMAFSDCRWLTTVHLGTGLVEIGMQTFMDCINLTSIELPVGITMLPPSLFAGCKRLTTVTLSDALTTVDDAVFRHCISLSDVRTLSGQALRADAVDVGRDNDVLLACLIP